MTNCAPTTEPQFVIIGVAVGGSGFGELGVGFVGARWPMTSPKRPIRPGHNTPVSKLRTVPETAPTATNRPATLAHRRASRGCVVIARQRDDASGNHCRKGDSEARKHDVKAQLLARLPARRHEAGWGSSRQRDTTAG